MTEVVVIRTQDPAASQIATTATAASLIYVPTGPQGATGPAGPAGPAGTGDMSSLIYDPQGVAANCFNLANLSGNLDGGTF